MIKEPSQEKLKNIREYSWKRNFNFKAEDTFILFRLCYIIMYIQCIYI